MQLVTTKKGLLRLVTVVTLVALAFWVGEKGDLFSFFSRPVTLSGSVPEVVRRSQPIHHAAPEAQLDIVVGLKINNEAELDALILRQQDPDSPDYHRFLTVSQFTERFAPTEGEVDDVVKYLTSNGIAVKRIYSNRLLIHAAGSVAQLEKAFNVTINEYQLPGSAAQNSMAASATYFSNDRDPSVPGFLKNIVQSVIGLNTFAAYESHMRVPHGVVPTPVQAPLSPRDVATAYDFPNQNNKIVPVKKYSGKGVNLAIVTANGYDRADVEAYWQQYGIMRSGTITDVPIDGVSKKLGDETTLDLELAGSQAPGANILMYIGASSSFIDFTMTYAQVVIDNKADVMTVSWGLCEERAGWMPMMTENLIFREAAVQGIALFASAGDDGAYDCGSDKDPLELSVDYPASNPLVTAVGGTALYVRDSVRVGEVTWESGGGGISSQWDRPAWQVAPTLPPGDKRATTDVSANGDPWTGYSFYFKGKWSRIGGTSASSPEWASLWALVLEATGQRVGSANFYVYKMGALKDYPKYFYDVNDGNNGDGVGPGYQAGTGWDIPSGWGTPDGAAIIDWMIQVSPKTPPEERSLGQKHPGLMFSTTFPIMPGPIFR
jgi:subtilase family serine protease